MLPTRSIGELRAALESGAHPRLAKAPRSEKQAWIESFVRECGYADLNREERGAARAYIQAVTGYSRAQMTRHVGAIMPKTAVIRAIRAEAPRIGQFYGIVGLASLMLLGIVVSIPRVFPASGSLAFLNAESTVAGVTPTHAERSIVVMTGADGAGNGGDVLFAMERTPVRADRPATALVAAANPGELRLRVEARRQARIDRVQSPIGGRGEQIVDDAATANGADFFGAIGSGLNGQVLTVKNGKIVWAFPNFTGTGRAPTPESNANDSDSTNDDRPARRGGGGGGGGSDSSGTTTSTTIIQTIDSDEWTDATGITYLTDLTQNVGIGTATPGAKLEVVGSISGTSLKLAGLANCNTIDTDAVGNLICGTDEGGVAGSTEVGSASFSGAVMRLADARYVNVGGDTMTGALAIDLSGVNAGVGLEVVETISGSIIFANRGLSTSGSLVWEESASGASLYVATSISGAGLVDCDLSSQALKWDAATGRFSCGTVSTGNWSGTGALQTAFDNRYVNRSGDTMTGALTINLASGVIGLEVIQTISGSTIYARSLLAASGSLAVDGTASFNSNAPLKLTNAGFFGCTALETDADGDIVCGSDADTDTNTTYSAGQGLSMNGTVLSLGSAISGSLLEFQTVSGATVFANRGLSSSGALVTEGGATLGGNLVLNTNLVNNQSTITFTTDDVNESLYFNNTDDEFQFSNDVWAYGGIRLNGGILADGTASITGNVGIGASNSTDKATLNVSGIASGTTLYATKSFSGAGLTDCDADNQVLHWDATTGRFSCGDDDSGSSYTAGQGLALNGSVLVLNSTITGSLLEFQTVSGALVYAKNTLASSGSLAVDGTSYFNSSAPLKLTDAGFFGCTALETDADGDIVCGSDGGGSTYAAGQGLSLNGTAISLNATITGSLVRFSTLSGSTVFAGNALRSSGSLVWEGAASGASLYVASSLNGAGLVDCDIAGSSKLLWDSTTGRFSCGTDQTAGSGLGQSEADTRYVNQSGDTMTGALTIDLASVTSGVGLEVLETISGSTIFASSHLASSGSLTVDGTTYLGDDDNTDVLIVNAGSQFYGAVSIGSDAADNVSFNGLINTSMLVNANDTYSIGNTSVRWGNGWFGNVTATSNLNAENLNATNYLNALYANVGLGKFVITDTEETVLFNEDMLDLDVIMHGDNEENLFFADASSDRIGIGTNAPKARLSINGIASGTTLYATKSFSGAGLTDCDADNQTLHWDATTGRFSCGDDDSGSSYTAGQGLALNGSVLVLNSTITGSLLEFQTVSGALVYAKNTLASSGSLAVDGTSYFNSSAPLKLTDAGFFGCTALETDADGDIVCGSDADTNTTYAAGQGLSLNGTSISLNATITGSLLEFQTVSGSTVYASKALRSSGSLVWEGAASGASLYIGGTFEGAGLSDCDADGQALSWDATTKRFTCGDDDAGGSPGIVGHYVLASGDTMTGALQLLNTMVNVTGSGVFTAYDPNDVVLVVKGTSLQSGLLQEWRDENNVSLASVSPTGNISTSNSMFIGSDNSDYLYVAADVNSSFNPDANNSYSLGNSGNRWATGWLNNLNVSDAVSVLGTSSFTGNVGIGPANTTTKARLSVSGVASGTTLYATKSFSGAGLTDCDADNQTLHWDATTGRFSCGDDDTGGSSVTAGQGLALNGSVLVLNSTITGSLLEFQTVSGAIVHAEKGMTSSGRLLVDNQLDDGADLIVRGTNNAEMYLQSDYSGNTNSDGLYFAMDDVNGASLINLENGTFALGTNGLSMLVMHAGGNVGIGTGTSTPDAKLEVTGTVSGALLYVTDYITGPSSTVDVMGHIVPTLDGFYTLGTDANEWYQLYSNWGTFSFGLGIGTETASSQAKLEVGGTASGRVLFANDALRSSGSLVVEGLSTLHGNVGIGTTSNSAALEVLGTVSGSALTINGGMFVRGGNGDVNNDGSATALDLLMVINYMNGGGSSGILTPEEYQRADVNGDGMVNASDYYMMSDYGILDAGENAYAKHIVDMAFQVDAEGDVGIGTSSPDAKLAVVGAISGSALTINGNVGIGIAEASTTQALHIKGDNEGLRIEDGSSTEGYDIARNDSTGYLEFTGSQNNFSGYRFLINDTEEAVTFLNSGNVGIGNATPDAELDVVGTISGSALKVADSVYVGKTTGAGKIIAEPPPVQTVTGGATITDNACGTVKELNAGSSVTTNTTNTFTAPSAANAGCVMYVVNVDTVDTITLDFNANFKTYAGIDVSLTALDGVIVASNGTTWYQVSYIANNNDLAEWIPYAGAKPQPGDVLAIADDEESVEISSSPYDAKIIGVVSTAPGLLMGRDGDDSVPLALAGRVPVKVTGEGGPIAPGDLLTSSSTPGHAMKATRGGPTVGKALAAFDGNGAGTVLAFVNVASYGPASNAFEIVSGSGTDVTAIGTDAQMVFTADDADDRALVVLDSEETTATQELFVITSDVGSDENTVFKITADGNAYSDEAFNSAGADYAEWFRASTGDLKPGDVVCVDVTRSNTVKRCDQDGDGNVMGIVSTNPAFIGNSIGGAQGLIPPGYALVGLIGQVPAKVMVENGEAIRAGDSLTAASVPGYARKASAGESTVGVALEPLESGEGVVNVLISRRNQSLTVSAIEQKVLDQIQAMEIDDEVEIMVAEAMGDLDVDQAIIDEVARQVESLNVAGVVQEEVARQVGELRDALIVEASTGAIAAPAGSDLVASTLQLTASLSVDGDARIVGDLHLDGALMTNDLFVPGILAVDGSLTANTAHVTGDASVHGALTLHGPLVMGSGASLQFGSGLTLADLVVERSLAVLGDVTVHGMATFLGDVAVEGELTVARQAGHLKVPLGATGATFAFDPPFKGLPIVTASPNKPVLYAVSVATSTGFTVSLAGPAEADVTFSWVALVVPADAASIEETPSGMVFPVDERGVPVSSSLQWNACIRGMPLFDASGVPYSCSRYHNGNTWEHPDLGISFVWNDAMMPPYMQLPDGYVSTVTENSESVRAAILDVNGIQAPVEEGDAEEPAAEAVEPPATGTGGIAEEPAAPPVEEPAETPAEELIPQEEQVAPVEEAPASAAQSDAAAEEAPAEPVVEPAAEPEPVSDPTPAVTEDVPEAPVVE